MSKIGRNDLCPCGSGKKYKKCCMDKAQPFFIKPESEKLTKDFKNYMDGFWSYEEATLMSTAEIIQKLDDMGIPFDEMTFLTDTEKFSSAEELSESWFQHNKVKAKGRDEDFPYYAALLLWERLTTDYNMPREKMRDLIDAGFEHLADNESVKTCNVWFKVWEGLKHQLKPEYKNLDFFDDQYKSSFFASNFCQDLESELYNAGKEDPSYFYKRINYCREFCSYFPDEDELILHNMKRAIIESFASLGNFEQAESECNDLIRAYPNNPWGYIQWGDLYFFGLKKDHNSARIYYEKAKTIARDKDDLLIVEDRLADLDRSKPC